VPVQSALVAFAIVLAVVVAFVVLIVPQRRTPISSAVAQPTGTVHSPSNA
jgi:hypothetical protein